VDRVITLNRSAKAVLSVSLIVVAGIAMYNWIVSPHVGYLYAVQDYEPVVKEAAKEKNLLHRALGVKRRKLDAMQVELSILRAKLFTPDEARDFFGNVEALGRKAGCAVSSVDFDFKGGESRNQTSPDPAVTLAYRANLTVLGRYDRIIAFLNDLQTRPQRVCIDPCRIELVDIQSAGLKCDVTVTISVICVGEDPNDE
jgi:Tfp pilus assembly protein PilO